MNKQGLVDYVSDVADLDKNKASKAIDAVLQGIKEGLVQNKEVRLLGFGSFTVQDTAARTGRNPRNNEPIDIPASKRISFKIGKELKDAITGNGLKPDSKKAAETKTSNKDHKDTKKTVKK